MNFPSIKLNEVATLIIIILSIISLITTLSTIHILLHYLLVIIIFYYMHHFYCVNWIQGLFLRILFPISPSIQMSNQPIPICLMICSWVWLQMCLFETYHEENSSHQTFIQFFDLASYLLFPSLKTNRFSHRFHRSWFF